MIIDRILDRKDNARYGECYDPQYFYLEMLTYGGTWGDRITRAMDYLEEEDVQNELCAYIEKNEYNPLIKNYIHSVTWLTETPLHQEITAVIQFEVDMALATMNN